MTTTYTPLPEGSTPVYGTSGSSVAKLQAELNTKNAGQTGYTPLVVDGKYGPLTAAAAAYKAPTISDVYSIAGVDPNIAKAGEAVDKYNQNQASGIPNVDEAAIRNATLANFQAEIDATNSLYASKLAASKAIGAGRLGTDTAIQARRGLLGSDFGAARTDTVNKANEADLAAIEAEKNTAIKGILSSARTAADQRIAEKNAAIGSGLTAHLSYLQNSAATKEANATKAAQSIYDQNLTPETLTADQLKLTAEGYGVKPEDIKSAYLTVKKTGDEAKSKKAAEDAKNKAAGMKIIPTGSVLVDANGKVIARGNPKAASVPKTNLTPVKSGKAVFTPDQMSAYSATLEASKGPDNYVDPDVYKQAYDAWVDPEVGGLAKDFLLKFPPKKYVNPANTTLPSYLRSSTVKAKTDRSL